MPNQKDPQTIEISERDLRLAKALIATASCTLAPKIASYPTPMHGAMELINLAGCSLHCEDSQCATTPEILDWLAQAISHVDHGATLEAQEVIEEFFAGASEPLPPPSLMRRVGRVLFPGFVS